MNVFFLHSFQRPPLVRKVGVILQGFEKGTPQNLPRVSMEMMMDFFNSNNCYIQPGCQHHKVERSKGENYSPDAVGYVQLKREDSVCTLHARVTPETKVSAKAYEVIVVIDERSETISSAQCQDCVAAAGGCKHAGAVLGWLFMKSSEKSVTSTESYWKKSRLSSVPAEIKSAAIEVLRPKQRSSTAGSSSTKMIGADALEAFRQEVLQLGTAANSSGLFFNHYGAVSQVHEVRSVGVDRLLQAYVAHSDAAEPLSAPGFLAFCKERMCSELCDLVAEQTCDQSQSWLWHAMRFGRVTASKAYAAAHCQKLDGTIVSGIVGAATLKDSAAMERGRVLEPQVLDVVGNHLGVELRRAGLILSPNYPMFGASPDGLTPDGSVVEVKCPVDEKNFHKYILANGQVAARFRAQLQMLMTLASAKRSFFCVAHPDFERSGRVSIVELETDEKYSEDLLNRCDSFWKAAVFPVLVKSYSSV
ncbi:uncharacterized protein LOC122363763 [Amphibalanus amphitrite]|uniref:uncharacterized protein LOC122363763 n=1 Tax=Amphibalanus amphitrite TaxID=1232801 RepID=UPI001C9209F5|nr:uncharacterized protein LOC122363763 [Amphibalanus amphitrite]